MEMVVCYFPLHDVILEIEDCVLHDKIQELLLELQIGVIEDERIDVLALV